jgi:eukaryotic-like serine/threonine-protein kinase
LVANLQAGNPELEDLSSLRAYTLMVDRKNIGNLPSVSQSEFLRARLSMLALFLCSFSLTSIGVTSVVGSLVPSIRQPDWPLDTYSLLAIGLAALFGVTWALSRWKAASPRSLRVLDALSTITVGAAMGAIMLHEPAAADSPAWSVFGVMLILSARAAMLPSTTKRTFWLGLATSAPPVLLVYLALGYWHNHPDPIAAAGVAAMCGTMLFLSVLVQTATSRVIYGLRQEVHTALRLGQYTLEEKLGEGGMGAVYRAQHAMLRRPTAVKLLLPDRTREQDVQRFEREVQKTAQLTHPNTVTVFDYGCTHDGIFYYAMEYLDGASLGQVVEVDGPQPPERVAWILRQVAGALVEAHASGLIHRDIKPANIILCERGGMKDIAKVVDFGLVKDMAAKGLDLTHARSLTGTPLFISPEALTDPDELDGRSDLYALGAVGYYLLTGKFVFDGNSVVEVCGHHLHTEPEPPSMRLGAELPECLESLLLACLEKDPARRPQCATELVETLEAMTLGEAWTQARARQWWDRHGESLHDLRRRQVKSASGRTLAVDLHRLRSMLWDRRRSASPGPVRLDRNLMAG